MRGNMKKEIPEISVVVPIYNEEQSLKELVSGILKVFEETDDKNMKLHEILLIDDGSSDNSWNSITQLKTATGKIIAIKLRKNVGKSIALQTGFTHASGDIIITIDADLQDDPAEIPKLVAKLQEGYDLVSGWKLKRKDPLSKTIPSKLFNFAVTRMFGLKLHDINCGFKAYRSTIAKSLVLYGEFYRFIPIILSNRGYKISEVLVKHHPRKYGKSKYGIERMPRGALDFLSLLVITRFLNRPGHFFGFIGLVIGSAGFLILSYLSVIWFLGTHPIGNRPLFFLGILLLLLSAQIIATGVLAELINFHHRESKNADSVEIINK